MNNAPELDEVRSKHAEHLPLFEMECEENAQLGQWVLEAVRGRERSLLKAGPFDDNADLTFAHGALLRLIVYCYAAGIYASEDIEARLQRDGIIRVLCGPDVVGEREILRFRRNNASTVVSCLERTLLMAWSRATDNRHSSHASTYFRKMKLEKCDTGLPCQEMLAAEARRRVRWAMFLDSTAQDE